MEYAGKNTVAGTEINDTANMIVANTMNPATAASVMVREFHVNPALAPVSAAIIPRPAIGIENTIKIIIEIMPRRMPAPIASTIFMPMYPA